MDKNNFTVKNDTVENLQNEQLFFKINNRQVVFKTDKRTVEKLDDGMSRNLYIVLLLIFFFQILEQSINVYQNVPV